MSKKQADRRQEHSAQVFAALGDASRLRIVVRLSEGGPLSITQLAEGAAVTRQAVTKHLRVLALAGLARCQRRGREKIWRLEPDPLDDARQSLEAIARRWDSALARLKAFVEEGE